MESRNLSIMLTDLRGYSARSATSSRVEIAELIRAHNNLLRPVIGFYRGRVVKTLGDSFLCVFESATDASVCAIAIQILVQEYNNRQREAVNRLEIRVMISSGDVTIDEGDVFGEAVNLVARMESLPEFEHGGVGMSESTYLLMNRQEIVAEELGERAFKGISAPATIYRIPLDKQKLTQLPTKLLDLAQQVSEGKTPPATPPPPPPPDAPAKSAGRPRTLLIVGTVAVVALVVVGSLRYLRRARVKDSWTVVEWLRQSDMEGNGTIQAKHFVGPMDAFRKIDLNGDSVLTRDEIKGWAIREGIRLGPPGGRALRRKFRGQRGPFKNAPPDGSSPGEGPEEEPPREPAEAPEGPEGPEPP